MLEARATTAGPTASDELIAVDFVAQKEHTLAGNASANGC
jgi:hypothetical protein